MQHCIGLNTSEHWPRILERTWGCHWLSGAPDDLPGPWQGLEGGSPYLSIRQAQGHSSVLSGGVNPSTSQQWLIREAACVFNRGNGRVDLVRLVCSLKAVAMLIEREYEHRSQWEVIEHTCPTGTLPIEREERYLHRKLLWAVSMTVRNGHKHPRKQTNNPKQNK